MAKGRVDRRSGFRSWPRLEQRAHRAGRGPPTRAGRERRAVPTTRQITYTRYRLDALSFQDSSRCLMRAVCTSSGCSTNGVCPAPEMLKHSTVPLARAY